MFEEHTPEELGIRGTGTGLPRNETIASGLSAAGLERRFINRFDTRHEVSGPFDWGIFRVVPFVVGRITAYDDDFESFGGETDQVRVFTALGVRIGTELQHVDNGVESRLFDLHRLRHIVEPSATIWFADSDVSQEDLPVYDLNVESLGTGALFRVGVRNTLQTQRGGPGQWRSVDFLTVDTNLVFHSSDSDLESPTPQTFDFRPELSQFGDHVRSEMIWLVTDTLALTGEATYDLDESAVARGAVGVELRHSPVLTTFVEFRYIDASDSELLGMGWNYRLTPIYKVILTPSWDFHEDQFRSADVSVARSFPDFVLTLRVRYDRIADETTFGASIGLVTF